MITINAIVDIAGIPTVVRTSHPVKKGLIVIPLFNLIIVMDKLFIIALFFIVIILLVGIVLMLDKIHAKLTTLDNNINYLIESDVKVYNNTSDILKDVAKLNVKFAAQAKKSNNLNNPKQSKIGWNTNRYTTQKRTYPNDDTLTNSDAD